MEHVDLAALDRKEYAIATDYHLPNLLQRTHHLLAQAEKLLARWIVVPKPPCAIGEPTVLSHACPTCVDPNHKIRARQPEPIPRR